MNPLGAHYKVQFYTFRSNSPQRLCLDTGRVLTTDDDEVIVLDDHHDADGGDSTHTQLGEDNSVGHGY